MIEAILVGFAICAFFLFRYASTSRAVVLTCFGGWLLLPVGNYPPGSDAAIFPFWIIGAALPSDMLLTKSWWPPFIALIGALAADRKALIHLRPEWLDVPLVCWCLWPLGQWPFVANPEPEPWISSLYLTAAWGAPWILGRAYFFGRERGRLLLKGLVGGLIIIVPIALAEGIFGPIAYNWLYEVHPFRFDGAERYVGFRPLAFFEDGNQYGIWVAAIALAAIWFWLSGLKSRERKGPVAWVALMVALFSQSAGAILLLSVGLVLCWGIGRPVMRLALALTIAISVSVGVIYLSGVVPMRALAENTAVGKKIVNVVRSSGRGSFIWRMARDQDALKVVSEHPLIGTERWDWWKEMGQRPWGLFLLILGQFGFIGVALAFGSLFLPVWRTFASHWNTSAFLSQPAIPIAAIVLIAIIDALLNSFILYPAILAAGALVEPNAAFSAVARLRER